MVSKISDNLSQIELKSEGSSHPFASLNFLRLIEDSKSIGPETGWHPIYFSNENALLFSYLKTHSYGEYIFDWAWADLFDRMGKSYYPKLIHAIPFTPVNAPKYIGKKSSSKELIQSAINFYQSNESLSSHHFYFIDNELADFLKDKNYFIKKTIQYHFHNSWQNGEDFLNSLKSRKRKQLKKERASVLDYNLEIKTVYGDKLSIQEMQKVYDLYLTTIDKKRSYAYLTKDFFLKLPQYLGKSLVINFAKKENETIAMSIFIKSQDTLYGRYWGILPEYNYDFKNLHFEMCYYMGLDLCFEEGLKLFEAGAQGEQKLLRGFRPVEILSAHHIRDKTLSPIIEEHNHLMNQQTEDHIEELKKHLPFKLD